MKIVSLVWFKIFPAKYGGQKGIALFLKHLSAYFEITCICSKDNIIEDNILFKTVPILPIGKWQFINPVTWIKILKHIKKEKADLLILEHPYHAITGILAKMLFRIPVILHQHNIEYIRFREMGKRWWPLLKIWERWISKNADLILFKTIKDQETAIKLFQLEGKNTTVIPYGVEIMSYDEDARNTLLKRFHLDNQTKIFLFAGTLDYSPNAQAVENIYSKLVPLLDRTDQHYVIIICGRNKMEGFEFLNTLQAKNVIMAGEVADINEYYFGADVFINPVEAGGGIQTKTIDAASCQLPVICFKNMLAGIPSELLETVVYPVEQDSWEQFANKMLMVEKQCSSSKLSEVLLCNNWNSIAKMAAEKINLI
jgi:glycosyltransferase involved in cell wall biosynthesis